MAAKCIKFKQPKTLLPSPITQYILYILISKYQPIDLIFIKNLRDRLTLRGQPYRRNLWSYGDNVYG